MRIRTDDDDGGEGDVTTSFCSFVRRQAQTYKSQRFLAPIYIAVRIARRRRGLGIGDEVTTAEFVFVHMLLLLW